ncbi:MAG: aldolase/citrate lyase family protein [Acidimicrobiales bacterium]
MRGDVVATLKERVRDGALMKGTFLNLGSPLVAEVLALSGFEWLLVDLEHGVRSEEALISQLLAGGAHQIPMFVRVESAQRIRVGHVLDLGADGVMFPRLNTPDEVREALSHLWYPPQGDRGVAGYNRARQFGSDARDSATVNTSLLALVQIETLPAIENVSSIAAIPGVDVLFVGPSDLSTSMGIAGQFDAPEFTAALDKVVDAARKANVAAGILAADPERVGALYERGFTFVSVASDSALLRSAATAVASVEPS